MNRHILPTADQHQQIQLLLPWYHNQTLDQNERQQVENHLRSCLICRREMNEVSKLATAIKQSSVLDVAADTSFASLREKLQTTRPVTQTPAPFLDPSTVTGTNKIASATSGLSGDTSNRSRWKFRFNSRTLKSFAIAASIFLVIIPVMMQFGQQSSGTADYFTLSATKQEVLGGAKLRVVFEKSLSVVGIESLLEKIHGQIVDGPNLVGGYTLRLGIDKDTAIALLRSESDVVLVEPVVEE
jgi:hypothetical protein